MLPAGLAVLDSPDGELSERDVSSGHGGGKRSHTGAAGRTKEHCGRDRTRPSISPARQLQCPPLARLPPRQPWMASQTGSGVVEQDDREQGLQQLTRDGPRR